MSYILDALKKAESERNLGAVPNVHTQAQQATAEDDGARLGKWLPWSIAAIAIGIALVVLLWLQPRSSVPAPTLAPAAVTNGNATVNEPVAANPPAQTPVAISTNTATDMAASTTIVPANPVPAAAAVTPKPEQPAAETRHAQPIPQPKPEPAKSVEKAKPQFADKDVKSTSATTPSTSVTPAPVVADNAPAAQKTAEPKTPAKADNADNDVGTAKDLPSAIQVQLPAVAVNGYIYSKDPTDRSVLMNQKLLHEGDTVAQDLTLEKLLPKGAILNYKGYRYRVAF